MYDTKLTIALTLSAVAVLIAVGILIRPALPRNLGIAVNEANFKNASSTYIECGATAVGVSATTTGRVKFIAQNVSGTQTAILCLNASSACTLTSGYNLFVSSTYEQKDAYIGPYSCISAAAPSSGIQIVQWPVEKLQ